MRIVTKIKKGPIPISLQNKSSNWTQQLLDEIDKNANDATKVAEKFWNKYRKEDIKKALKEECFGKCMYCDTKIGVSDYEQIEHILPKKLNPELTYQWRNLGWACQKCNGLKKENEIINPYEEDFELKFKINISMWLTPKRSDDYKTKFFIEVLQLNSRVDLVAKRCSICNGFENNLMKLKELIDNEDPNAKYFYKTLILEMEQDKEYYIFKKNIHNNFFKINGINLDLLR